MKLSIIVPVFNEEKTISRVLDTLLSVELGDWQKEIVVVNDCSTDKTGLALKKYRRRSNLKILSHEKNQGKGAAIRTGLREATGDYCIIQDADLEYNPSDINILLAAAIQNPNTPIYGSRFKGKHEDTVFGHKTANLFLTYLTNFLYGSTLSDMETCYKLIPKAAFKTIKLECSRFDFEPEITAKLLIKGYQILEVPISFKKRGFSEGKKIRFQDGLIAIFTLFKYRF